MGRYTHLKTKTQTPKYGAGNKNKITLFINSLGQYLKGEASGAIVPRRSFL